MEHFRKLERMYAAAPINGYFKPTLVVDDERATVTIDVIEDFHHAAGAMHGSVYFKALDDAAFFAANSVVHDAFVLTASFQIDLLRPFVVGEIRALGRVIERDGRRIRAQAELLDAEGETLARGDGLFIVSKIPLTPDVHYR